MPADPQFFTVEALYKSVVADSISDIDADPQFGPVTATVTFTPMLKVGDVILAVNNTGGPVGYVPAPIVGRIDTDGHLKLRDAPDKPIEPVATFADLPAEGSVLKTYRVTATGLHYAWDGAGYVETYGFQPVRLLDDTELLDLDGDLYYDVRFTNVQFNGGRGDLSGFGFKAPGDGSTVNLIEVGKVPGIPVPGVTRGPRGWRTRAIPITEGASAGLYQWVDELGEPVGDPEELADFVDLLDAATVAATTAATAAAPAAVAGEASEQVPSAVSAEVSAAVPAAVDADISGRSVTIVDEGGGVLRVHIGGAPTASTFTLPPATLAGLAAATLVAKMTVAPSALRRALIEELIYDLMIAGIWDKLDGLYVLAAHTEQAAKLNWLGTGMQDLTPVNAPVFEIDRGFTGDGATNYLDTNTPANTLTKYASNDAMMGVYVRTMVTATNRVDISAGTSAYLNSSQAGSVAARANSSSGSAVLVPHGGTGSGTVAWTRDASNVHIYRGGSLIGSGAVGAGSLASANVRLLVLSTLNYSTRQLQAGFIGKGLSAAEHAALNTALVAYLTAIGAN